MADSTTNLDTIAVGQAQKEVTANANDDAASPALAFGRHASACVGLTWGYYGGVLPVNDVPTTIANGTLSLTASSTCYIYRDVSALADSPPGNVVTFTTVMPSGWPGPLAGVAVALYTVTTGTASATPWVDHRLAAGVQGATGSAGASGGDFTKIAEVVCAASQATAPFPTISGAYRNLKVIWTGKASTGNLVGLFCKINGDATAGNYLSNQYMGSDGSAVDTTTANGGVCGVIPGAAGKIGGGEILFPNYVGTAFIKIVQAQTSGTYTSSQLTRQQMFIWNSTAAITDLVFTIASGNFDDGTTFTLYGMK